MSFAGIYAIVYYLSLYRPRYAHPVFPHEDDIVYVGPWDVGSMPISDWCTYSVQCQYEVSSGSKITPIKSGPAQLTVVVFRDFAHILFTFKLQHHCRGVRIPIVPSGSIQATLAFRRVRILALY